MGHWKDLKNTAHHHVHYVRSIEEDDDNELGAVKNFSEFEILCKRHKLTIRQQLQVLHYLGELIQYEGMSKNKKSDALAKVLGKKSSQGIREIFFRYPELIKSNTRSGIRLIRGDLNHLLIVFTKEDRTVIVSRIKEDISKLGEEKQ